MRVNQIEEQLSNTLKGIDKLTEDVQVFREYAIENNKVVNGILRKLDDHAERMDKFGERMDKFGERMDKFLVEMAEERKQRQKEIAEERKERQLEMEEVRKQWQAGIEEDRRLRMAEMALINKRLERLENMAQH